MADLIGAVAAAVVFTVLIWLVAQWAGRENKESRQYRREMYRQQQASWHAQEEAWSRMGASIQHGPPKLRLSKMYRERMNYRPDLRHELQHRRWECQGSGVTYRAPTPQEAFDGWRKTVK
jgi:hypothetical protein